MRLTVFILSLLFLGAGGAAADEYYEGMSAYNQGKYALAMKSWRGLAERGDAKAQSSLGFMYYKGLGVTQNSTRAAEWFYRAAVQGQAVAQTFLGIMHRRGEGVPVNLVLSHMWCDLAVSQGYDEALECREIATHSLTQSELEESEQLVIRYRKLHARP